MPEAFQEPAVVTAMRQFKVDLIARERFQMWQMASRWETVEQTLDADINLLAREMDEMRRAGKSISPSRVYRLERYQHLRGQAEREVGNFANQAARSITNAQEGLVELGVNHAAQAIQLSYSPGVGAYFNRLPVEAVQHMVGIAGNGKPLGALLRQRTLKAEGGLTGWNKLTDALVRGTARGQNPRETAREMRDSLTGGLQKALVIARTEQMRVYRQAGLDQYKASGVVEGQKRLTAHDGRVCIACLADDGARYSLDQVIPDHPQGRCTGVPIVKGMDEITWLMGEEWFIRQSAEDQLSIMGPARLDAWRYEQVKFKQMGARTFDSTWGGGLEDVSLKDLGLRKPTVTPEIVGERWLRDIRAHPGTVLNEQETSDNQMVGWLGTEDVMSNFAKDEIVTKLVEQTGLEYDDVNLFIGQWAQSSNDEDMRSLAIQRDAAIMLGQDLPEWQQNKILDVMRERQGKIESVESTYKMTEEEGKGMGWIDAKYYPLMSSDKQQQLLRAMYDNTQERLDAEGIGDTIRLRRGMLVDRKVYDKWEVDVGAWGAVDWSPDVEYSGSVLESWSVNSITAEGFADVEYAKAGQVGVVFEMDIPRERLISSARSGFGCLSEYEFVHLGAYGDEKARVVFVSESGEETDDTW